MHGYVLINVGPHEGQKRVSNVWELELQVVMTHLTRVLETEHRPFARAGSALNHRTFSQVLG